MNVSFEWRDAPAADFAVIGDPIAHSRSPQMHQAAYAALGMPYRYVAIRVSVGKVAEALDHLASLGYRGVNVTVPHKAEAMQWANAPDDLANRTGVANTLNLLDRSATNTDAVGFLDTLDQLNVKTGASVLILGAGGSARAVASVLPHVGYRVAVWNRTESRARELAREFEIDAVTVPHGPFDLLINTTSASLQSDKLPIDWSRVPENGIAYDLVYGDTPFLRDAGQRGLRTVDGKALLVAQGARSFEWWLGVAAPREVMLEAIQ